MAKKKTTKKKTTRKKTKRRAKSTSRKSASRQVNKSAAIRDFASKNPSLGPTAIAQALSAKGIPVSPSFVSVVKGKSSGPKRARNRRSSGSTVRRTGGATVSIDQLKAAKRFANQMGGIDKAKAALAGLAQVLDA
jgi:hypothetical protein